MKINVKVIALNGKNLPLDFPWINGVDLELSGDLTKLANLQKELNIVKNLVNKDINRFKLNLKDFEIILQFNQIRG